MKKYFPNSLFEFGTTVEGRNSMRVLMTPEIAKLHDEVKPYLDEHFDLVPDAPEDIKKKNAIIDAYMEKEYQKSEKMNR